MKASLKQIKYWMRGHKKAGWYRKKGLLMDYWIYDFGAGGKLK